jgi:hypothetical protein
MYANALIKDKLPWPFPGLNTFYRYRDHFGTLQGKSIEQQ